MKQILFIGLFLLLQSPKNQTTIKGNLKYCESTLWNGDVLYISNFGSSILDPLNHEGKGYIAQYKDGKISDFIIADNHLNAPRGMAIKNNFLFIADVNAVIIYNIANVKEAPRKIIFPSNIVYINDLFINGDLLYITATDVGKIYTVNIKDLKNLGTPIEYAKVPGANGIIIANKKMYVASTDIHFKVNKENIIYVIDNLANPQVKPLISEPGIYDGLAISADNKILYFTNWAKENVGSIDLTTKKITYLTNHPPFKGPADMSLRGDYLYVPDLVNSVVIPVKIK